MWDILLKYLSIIENSNDKYWIENIVLESIIETVIINRKKKERFLRRKAAKRKTRKGRSADLKRSKRAPPTFIVLSLSLSPYISLSHTSTITHTVSVFPSPTLKTVSSRKRMVPFDVTFDNSQFLLGSDRTIHQHINYKSYGPFYY